MTDMDHWGMIDRWNYPDDGYGDCEDYVLQKRKMLIQAGWPREALLITVVRDKLEAMAKRLNVGHLMVVLQFGSMPHHVACNNIELFGREVLPHLQEIWEDKAFENAWWPKKLRNRGVKQREMATA